MQLSTILATIPVLALAFAAPAEHTKRDAKSDLQNLSNLAEAACTTSTAIVASLAGSAVGEAKERLLSTNQDLTEGCRRVQDSLANVIDFLNSSGQTFGGTDAGAGGQF